MKYSKFFLSSIILLVMVLVSSVQAQAALDLIGQGTSTHGTYNLIYDTHLDVTWYDYTNFPNLSGDTWQNQVDWASTLSVTFGINTYSDWRLPITDTTCPGATGCTDSEMGHLYYTELGNTGDFQNLLSGFNAQYWSGTESISSTSWYFNNNNGTQYTAGQVTKFHAIAVRSGLAVVPEPVSSTLFIIGGATLGFRRFKKKIKSI